MKNKDDVIEERATMHLLAIGIPTNLAGFRYIRRAIHYVVNDQEILSYMTKRLYPVVGSDFNANGAMVERSIRHAIEVGYAKKRLLGINELFNIDMYDLSYKPTNGEIIALIAEKILFELKELGYEVPSDFDDEGSKNKTDDNKDVNNDKNVK